MQAPRECAESTQPQRKQPLTTHAARVMNIHFVLVPAGAAPPAAGPRRIAMRAGVPAPCPGPPSPRMAAAHTHNLPTRSAGPSVGIFDTQSVKLSVKFFEHSDTHSAGPTGDAIQAQHPQHRAAARGGRRQLILPHAKDYDLVALPHMLGTR